jgi:hypothetical protein
MLINEVAAGPDAAKLLGLVEFLAGRAQDTNARRQISKATLINLAQQLGVNINTQNLADVVNRPPLDQVLEPMDPAADTIQFKGAEPTAVGMPVDHARDVVSKAAKSAMNRRR